MSFAKNYYGLIGLAIELGFVPVLVCYALVSLRQACVVSKFLDRKRLLVRFSDWLGARPDNASDISLNHRSR